MTSKPPTGVRLVRFLYAGRFGANRTIVNRRRVRSSLRESAAFSSRGARAIPGRVPLDVRLPDKLGVVPVYDNEQLCITDSVRRLRVVEGLAYNAHLDNAGCERRATRVRLLPRPRNCARFDVSRGQAEAVDVGS
jgi:hypothetical protein